MLKKSFALLLGLCIAIVSAPVFAQKTPFIPRRQDKPPGPPLSPEEAVKKMTVPEGFKVEIVAAEPQIVNPVAMAFDERGRIWVTESLEYPRRSAGKGRDRVKTLEDTDGDGRVDKVTVFAEGLNIPSGVAVGHGGVWVANSPDILFMQDTDGDGKADKQRVVVTGFGRTDTHELPNSLTWGPDGWLYGLNGVFNHSHVRYPKSNPNFEKAGGEKQSGWKLTCAMFRIHPRTWEFQVFAEGTSNPWGIAFNEDGEAFVSACVIDHLWHITETGYYHRQGGPYPPHTWKIGSIVKHKHQKAAYCGLTWFDSDVYPEKYRRLLYMGNIHGGCINVDRLHRDGSTYRATPEPDFLTANDVWFMPVVQKTGPDGCLYILDWYDRYHCYQDANRDPAGIEREKGRLYRVRYKDAPRVHRFDLAKESDEQLIKRLGQANVYHRETAQRLLTERLLDGKDTKKLRSDLVESASKKDVLALLNPTLRKAQLHALWVLIGAGQLDEKTMVQLDSPTTPYMRPWVARAIGNKGNIETESLRSSIRNVSRFGAWRMGPAFLLPPGKKLEDLTPEQFARLTKGKNPPARTGADLVQLTVAARKIAGEKNGWDALPILVKVLAHAGDDKLIPHIVWNNLQPLLEDRADEFLALARKQDLAASPGFQRMTPYLIERLLARRDGGTEQVASLFAMLTESDSKNSGQARALLVKIAERIQTRQLRGEQLESLRARLEPAVERILKRGEKDPMYLDAAFLAATWKHKQALEAVQKVFIVRKGGNKYPVDLRLKALAALIAADHPFLEHDIDEVLSYGKESDELHARLLTSLGRLNKPFVGFTVANNYEQFSPANRPKAIELLTQRTVWAKRLFEAIDDDLIPANAVNVNQVRRLLKTGDKELEALIIKHWGTVREDRDPKRELTVHRMRHFLRRHPGDAAAGLKVYDKVCGQCHKLHGRGQEVGPDITRNGRNSFEQLLSNVFDPSLVIGKDYQARTVITADGRTLTGLLVEDSQQRVVLKTQGGKLETIARGDVEQFGVSKLSMMPEGVEKQLKPQELADLFALITLDKPHTDRAAKRLAGVYEVIPQETTDSTKYNNFLAEVAPGFTLAASGERGVGLLQQHRGRKIVVRTHPLTRTRPAVIRSTVNIPKDKKTRLHLAVSHHEGGDWRLIVKANGKTLNETLIGPKSTKNGWADLAIDLTPFAGKQIALEIENRANDWSWEFAYWRRLQIVSE